MSGAPEGRGRLVDFDFMKAVALANAEAICRGLLPDGRREGAEWTARNPRRDDRRPGSFKVNLRTGKWGDFSSGDKGGDLISLAAFIAGVSQRESAIALAERLGVDPFEGRAR